MATKQRGKARRSYGTGSLQLVGRSWIGSWYDVEGRKVRRKIGPARTPGEQDGLTKAQAEERFRVMRGAERPVGPSTGRVTVARAGEELCRRLEIRGRKRSHRLTVASDLHKHVAPFFGERSLDKIEPEDIERYVAVKLKTLAPKTVRNHLGTMHSVFELGLRRGWCARNPVKLADRPVIRKTETRIKFLDQAELEALLETSYPQDAFGGERQIRLMEADRGELLASAPAGRIAGQAMLHRPDLALIAPSGRTPTHNPTPLPDHISSTHPQRTRTPTRSVPGPVLDLAHTKGVRGRGPDQGARPRSSPFSTDPPSWV